MNTGFLGPAVATVLTACGIETHLIDYGSIYVCGLSSVATVLTACGIETDLIFLTCIPEPRLVATVLTACGIETEI